MDGKGGWTAEGGQRRAGGAQTHRSSSQRQPPPSLSHAQLSSPLLSLRQIPHPQAQAGRPALDPSLNDISLRSTWLSDRD